MESSEPFGCNQCSKSFDTLSRYNQHLKTHTKPFKCGECVKGFALRSDLTRHVQARHRLGVARYPCVVATCSFKASRRDNIRQHVQKSHPQLLFSPGNVKPGRRQAKPHGFSTSISLGTPLDDQTDLSIASTCTLMQAASAGNLGFVQVILQSGIDISMQADDGSTALHCAAKADQTDMVYLLIESGARSDIVNSKGKGRTPLHEAILARCTSAFNILVQRRVDITEHILCATIRTNQTHMFQTAWAICDKLMFRLVGRELFEIAASAPETESMATLLLLPEITPQWIRSEGTLGVSRMIHKSEKAMMDCLLRSGKLDVNTDFAGSKWVPKRSLLYLAAAKGKSEIVSLLLESETVDLNSGVFHEIESPLGIAAVNGHLQIVEKLLQCPGIVVDGKKVHQGKATTSLHLACRRGHVGVIRLMLEAFDKQGLDVDARDTSNLRMTPLQNAVYGGHTEAVALLLLRQDVDVNRAFGPSRMSLCQAAAQGGHGKTLSVLLGDDRVDRNDVRNSRQSLLPEALLGGHWCLVEILFDYGSVPLNVTRQGLNLATEPSGKCIDILKRGLLDVAVVLPPQADNIWHRASRQANLSLAMLLLEHAQTYDKLTHPMVDINRRDASGRAPIHIAVSSGKIGIIELLLHHTQIDVNLTMEGPRWQRGNSAIEIVKRGYHGYWDYRPEERAYTVDLLLAHGAQTASRDRAHNANQAVLPPSGMVVEGNIQQSSEHSEDLRRKNHASWASVVGIHDGGGGPGRTNLGDPNPVDDIMPIDVNDPMDEDPNTMFEELMSFYEEERTNGDSLEMWEREMSLE